MPRVELSRRAIESLESLIVSHSLPADTPDRVRRILLQLATFPGLGQELGGRWHDHRVLLGPWRWMLLVYRIDDENERVVVVTVEDARGSTAATSRRH